MPRPLIGAAKKNYCRSVCFFQEEYYRVAREAIRANLHISEYIRQAVIEKMAAPGGNQIKGDGSGCPVVGRDDPPGVSP